MYVLWFSSLICDIGHSPWLFHQTLPSSLAHALIHGRVREPDTIQVLNQLTCLLQRYPSGSGSSLHSILKERNRDSECD